jgi:hypothetical protein
MRGRYTVDVLFPSWGKNASIEAILAGGRRVMLAGPGRPRRSVPLAKVAYFYVAGEDTGYVMLPVERRPKAMAHVLRPRAQSSSPRPGPTLALQLVHGKRFSRVGLAMRIAPARSAAEAAQVVRALGLGRRAKR